MGGQFQRGLVSLEAMGGVLGLCANSVLTFLGFTRLQSSTFRSLPGRSASAHARSVSAASSGPLARGFYFLLVRAVSGSLLSPLFQPVGLRLWGFWVFCCLLVQDNKVFSSFYFWLLRGQLPSQGGRAGLAPLTRERGGRGGVGVGREGGPPPQGRPCSAGAPPRLNSRSRTGLRGPPRVPVALPPAASP